MAVALARLPGVTVYPSEANFLTVRVPDAPRAEVNLRTAGILIKRLHGAHPMLEHCLRLTIGTPEENDTLLAALPACLGLEPTHV
jgi:histidinol-phosphate aminotransferase